MQTVPNWQAIAKNYCFVVSNRADVTQQMHVNINNEPSQVHFQREGVVSYYKRLLAFHSKRMPIGGRREGRGLARAAMELQCRKMAEAQFGLILIGIV